MLRLAKDIGSYLGDPRFDDVLVEQSFHKWWPDLHQAVMQAIESTRGTEPREVRRSDRNILEELVQLTRNLTQLISTPSSSVIEITAPVSSDSMVEQLKHELEQRRRMLLVTVLEGATRVGFDRNELYVEFEPNAKHLRDTLAKPENIHILRDAATKIAGRDIAIRIVVHDRNNRQRRRSLSDEVRDKERLIKMAENDPVVQEMLRTFRGEIKDVRRVKEEQD